jgi:hypothetical protein
VNGKDAPDFTRVDGQSIGKERVVPAQSKPFAEEMARAHTKLLSDLGELAHAIRTTSHTSLKELRARLGRARTDLAEHFRLEEQDGYMDAVKGRSPSQNRAIERLLGEHKQLLKTLDGIVTLASRSAEFSDRLRNKTLLWIQRVHAHERQENELMQDALSNEIAAED